MATESKAGDETAIERLPTDRLLSERWSTERDPRIRDRIVGLLKTRERTEGAAAWPSTEMQAYEEAAGLYPDPEDPTFAARLFSKREFYEARAIAASILEGQTDPCASAAASRVFELTPVQRIVSRFLHPSTPYNGMLLFHGVGVGKTCSAVTVAEEYLEKAPHMKVIVLAPHALQDNFKQTIFDTGKIEWIGDEATGQWSSKQCTGTSYLERLNLLETNDMRKVQYQVDEDKRKRYTITGYQAFANWIMRTLKAEIGAGLVDPELRREAEDDILRRLFSDHMIIVDEAHNLRDTSAEGFAADESPATGEASENKGGQNLHPFLKRIALVSEGLKLVLMTATPMYNTAPEILRLLNYLIMNDTKSEKMQIPPSLFGPDDELRPGGAMKALERAARKYVSYMRGENPFTFPLRLMPQARSADLVADWPVISATKAPVDFSTPGIQEALNAMPIVLTEPVPGSPPERLLRAGTATATATAAAGGAGGAAATTTNTMLDLRMQMANISYPNSLYGTTGWESSFSAVSQQASVWKIRCFSPKAGFDVDSVFAGEGLRTHAPKIHRIVASVSKARGISFVYSRYIKAGAQPLAVALERAGFQRRLADGTVAPLLLGSSVPPVAPICALCGHTGAEHNADYKHPFRPAYYILLTSDTSVTPSFKGLIKRATTWPEDPEYGPLGSQVKVIIGSQVASEGLDLKCVREMHILDAWYHLNRTDQIIGRAIRYCSHTALRAVEDRDRVAPMAYNNCLIYLHALMIPDFETADLYAYRLAIQKALMVGHVQRLIKKNAFDCNLELEAISFVGLKDRPQIDAQGFVNEGSLNDQDFTTYCDYQRCKHECAATIARSEEEGLRLDLSTFGVQDARSIVLKSQDRVRALFYDPAAPDEARIMIPETMAQDAFTGLPWEIRSAALLELLDPRAFQLTHKDGLRGYLVKKAGFLVFQPAAVTDTDVPITMRYARAFQIRRRFMKPRPVLLEMGRTGLATAASASVAPSAGGAAMGGAGGGPTGGPSEFVGDTGGPAAAAAAATATAPGPKPTSSLAALWPAWTAFLGGTGPMPVNRAIPSLWSWIIRHYAAIPESRTVASRWFYEKLTTYEDRVAFCERAIATREEPLLSILKPDLLMSSTVTAYRVYNPATNAVEYRCATEGGSFAPCSSKIADLIAARLGPGPLAIPGSVGSILGFLALKEGGLVFKTLDTTKKLTASTVGAECGNTSQLKEHHPRVAALHAAAAADPRLGPLMLPDSLESFEPIKAGAKVRMSTTGPEHMRDITHQPLCLYMEFLTRILDAVRLGGVRWYLSPIEALAVDRFKGKK